MEQIVLPYVFHSELLCGEKPLDEVRSCSKCGVGKLVLKNGRFGSFLGCSNYPTCGNVRNIALSKENEQHMTEVVSDLPRVLSQDPVLGDVISIKKGPYGLYRERGDGKNAKRSSIGKNIDYKTLSLERALVMLSLPRELGLCPKGMVVKEDKKFGPYLEYDGQFFSLKKIGCDALSISLKEALEFLESAMPSKKASGAQKFMRTRSSAKSISAKIQLRSSQKMRLSCSRLYNLDTTEGDISPLFNILIDSMSLLDAELIFKPFHYPNAYDFGNGSKGFIGFLKRSLCMADDVRDWKKSLTESEKHLLTQIFRLFTQADIEVNNCYKTLF